MCLNPLSCLLRRLKWTLKDGGGVGWMGIREFPSLTLQSNTFPWSGKGELAPCPPGVSCPTPQRAPKPAQNPDWLQCAGHRDQSRFSPSPQHSPTRRPGSGTAGAAGICRDLPGFAACSSPQECLAHLPTLPQPRVCHRGRSVDSTTRSGAGSQLSRDCSAPWQGNDRAQRVPVSPRKSCSAWRRDITWISSGRKRLGADRACKYQEKRLAWGSCPHISAALWLVGRAWSRMEMENQSRMEMENGSWAQILCVKDRR